MNQTPFPIEQLKILVPVSMLIPFAGLWLLGDLPLQERIQWSIAGAVIVWVMLGMLMGVNHLILEAGPYLVFDKHGNRIRLRENKSVSLNELASVEVEHNRPPGLSLTMRYSYLILTCKSGLRLEVIETEHHREIQFLRDSLVEHLIEAGWEPMNPEP